MGFMARSSFQRVPLPRYRRAMRHSVSPETIRIETAWRTASLGRAPGRRGIETRRDESGWPAVDRVIGNPDIRDIARCIEAGGTLLNEYRRATETAAYVAGRPEATLRETSTRETEPPEAALREAEVATIVARGGAKGSRRRVGCAGDGGAASRAGVRFIEARGIVPCINGYETGCELFDGNDGAALASVFSRFFAR